MRFPSDECIGVLRIVRPMARNAAIDAIGEDGVAVVNEKSIRVIFSRHHAQRLCRPIRRGMLGHIQLTDPSDTDLQYHERVEHAERGRDHHDEIARQDGTSMMRTKVLLHPPRSEPWTQMGQLQLR
jgi:hypothetical protein